MIWAKPCASNSCLRLSFAASSTSLGPFPLVIKLKDLCCWISSSCKMNVVTSSLAAARSDKFDPVVFQEAFPISAKLTPLWVGPHLNEPKTCHLLTCHQLRGPRMLGYLSAICFNLPATSWYSRIVVVLRSSWHSWRNSSFMSSSNSEDSCSMLCIKCHWQEISFWDIYSMPKTNFTAQ